MNNFIEYLKSQSTEDIATAFKENWNFKEDFTTAFKEAGKSPKTYMSTLGYWFPMILNISVICNSSYQIYTALDRLKKGNYVSQQVNDTIEIMIKNSQKLSDARYGELKNWSH